MERIAFFDFCETLVDFQTADAFVHFVRRKHGNSMMTIRNMLGVFLSKTYVLRVIDKLFHCAANKRMVLWQLKGLPQSVVEAYAQEYYHDMLVPHSIKAIQERLENLQKEGWRIVLVSGGYDVYLKCYARANGINPKDVISSKIQFKKGLCTGKMEGPDCMGRNKVTLIERGRVIINNNESVAFSDSKSDLPMLQWADTGYVISRGTSQAWAHSHGLTEIVW